MWCQADVTKLLPDNVAPAPRPTHPERAALLLALPFRGFTWLARPMLAAMQWSANAVLRAFRVEPQDALAAAHGPAELRMLLESSRQEGLLDPDQHQLLSRMLPLARTSLAQVARPTPATTLDASLTVAAATRMRAARAARWRDQGARSHKSTPSRQSFVEHLMETPIRPWHPCYDALTESGGAAVLQVKEECPLPDWAGSSTQSTLLTRRA